MQLQTRTESGVPYAIACAYFGGVDTDHLAPVLALEYGEPRVKVLRTHGVPYIDQARAILASAAMDLLPDDGVLMFLDHDIIFHPACVPILVERCAREMFDVLAVPYSMRKEGGGILGFPTPPKNGEPFQLQCFDGGGLCDAVGAGMGFTAIRMRVFRELCKGMQRVRCGSKTIVYPFFALELQPDHSVTPAGEEIGFYHGEDMSFCRRAIAAGFRVGLDTSIRIGHKGSKIYALEDTAFMVPHASSFTMNLLVSEDHDSDFKPMPAPPRAQKPSTP